MFGFLQSLLGGGRSAERRKAARYADDARVDFEENGREFGGRVMDVSATGARMLSTRRVDVGRPLIARVQLQNGCTHLPLVVKWVIVRGEQFEFGAVPDPNHPVARSLIKNYAARFVRHMPRGQAA